MAESHNLHICLDIPIPLSVQALPRSPPPSFHHPGDLSSIQALRDFGREFDVPEDEIGQACNLASGPSDIIVILERPNTSHNYKHPFPQFVGNCKTLWAVDKLIRFATYGARSIHTVTVLDAFTFKPKDRSHIPDERCHQLLAEVLRAKKPKVVIRCHRDAYKDPWMQQFELASKEPEYRCLLIYHFIAAFAELSGVSQLHEDAEEIRQLCTKKRDDKGLSEWSAPFHLKTALQWSNSSASQGEPVIFGDKPEYDKLRTRAEMLSEMYDWLEKLAGQSFTFNALGIAEAALLWKKYFESNPLYQQVNKLLLHSGSEQKGWFPTSNHLLRPIEDLSQLHISSSDVPGRIITGLHSPRIIETNKQAVAFISSILAFIRGEEVEKTDLSPKYYQAVCNTIANLVDVQNLFIDTQIRTSTLPQLSRTLRVQKRVHYCQILAEIIIQKEYVEEESKDKICEDLALLRLHLQQLIST